MLTTLLALGLALFPAKAPRIAQERGSPELGIWIKSDEISSYGASGAAWDEMAAAASSLGSLDLSDQDDPDDSRLLAAAMVAVRLGQDVRPLRAVALAAMGTEDGGRTLALARNLPCLVFAVDLIGLPPDDDARFRAWLAAVRTETLDGRTLVSTHEQRPNNWGTWAGAARAAADVYLGDLADLKRCAQVHAGWMGYPKAYNRFSFGELDWQADRTKPVGINAPGTTIQGHSVDGVLPDDQRRAGGFTWPPPKENYVWEALQGATTTCVILDRAGMPEVWSWKSSAILRAVTWLHTQAEYPAEGDDTWIVPIVNAAYGAAFPFPSPTRHGKGPGFTDWHCPVH